MVLMLMAMRIAMLVLYMLCIAMPYALYLDQSSVIFAVE